MVSTPGLTPRWSKIAVRILNFISSFQNATVSVGLQLKIDSHFDNALIIGTFVTTYQRPAEPLAHIHSKPVVYVNNGGGRDTYISDYSGGLRLMYHPAHGKATFYNSLRAYP